jgi:hypothetical protein
MLRSLYFSLAFWLYGVIVGHACSYAEGVPVPTEEDLFSKASAVFVAHLTKTEEIIPPGKGKLGAGEIEGTFTVIEVLKGQPPDDHKVRSMGWGPGNCTLPYLSGFNYIFFIDDNPLGITTFSGSSAELNLNAVGAKERLEKLRALRK